MSAEEVKDIPKEIVDDIERLTQALDDEDKGRVAKMLHLILTCFDDNDDTTGVLIHRKENTVQVISLGADPTHCIDLLSFAHDMIKDAHDKAPMSKEFLN